MRRGGTRRARHATALETLNIQVPEAAIPAYEAALAAACSTVGLFRDEVTNTWQLEGVKQQGEREAALAAALALAAAATGITALPERRETAAEGWLARSYCGFPEQRIGRRFAVRGTHLPSSGQAGRIVLTLDAAMAFGSGEHGSTRGCLIALERVAHRRPRRILDLGTGSGILAMAAARLLGQPVLGSDIDPWGVRVARSNARMNGLANRTRFLRADGWTAPALRRAAPYDLIFANILARPLCRMARQLAPRLAPGGTVILSGLLESQERWVLAAHRRHGLRLERRLLQGHWATLVLRR